MSSSTSDVDYGSDGSDQRFLADGESNGDGKSTNMITTLHRTESSTTPTMADAVARQRYAGGYRPVELKL